VSTTRCTLSHRPERASTLSTSPRGYPLKWKYRPTVDPNALGIACCDAANRGRFYATARSCTTCWRAHRRRRGGDGHGAVEDQDRGSPPGRDHAGRAPRREAPGHRRRIRRRVGIHGLVKALDSRDRPATSGPPTTSAPTARCWRKRDLQAFYDRGGRPGAHDWPADVWKNGGGAGVGMDVLHPSRPGVLRHRHPAPL